jgi:hypothetical protein
VTAAPSGAHLLVATSVTGMAGWPLNSAGVLLAAQGEIAGGPW